MPDISVIMNCYNGERYLREAIESVYAQDFSDWEIIFWDNASTDRSAEIAQSYDSRLKYYRGEVNVPLGAARRLALEKATGTWVGFLDTDDYWLPHKLSTQLRAVANTDHCLCYGGIREITPDGKVIREIIPKYASGDMLDDQLRQFDINMVTPILRRDALSHHRLTFDENVTASEEYNLFMRLLAKGTGCTVPEVLGVWRISPGSLTDRQISKLHGERRYTLDQLRTENPGLEQKHVEGFREAYARGDYYEARYLMSTNRPAAAARKLVSNARSDWRYGALALTALIPGLWSLVHGNMLKRKFLPLLFGTSRYK